MTTHRIVVSRDGKHHSQGTAWFLRSDIVVTAFHVVTPQGSSQWFHEVDDGFVYKLDFDVAGGRAGIVLQPLLADRTADIALLRTAEPVLDAENEQEN